MDKIIRKHFEGSNRDKGPRKFYTKEYTIYTKEEADQQGVKYRAWYDCQPGDWGLSDDGYVAECLKRKKYYRGKIKKKELFCLAFSFGQQFWVKGWAKKLLYLPHKESGSYSAVAYKSCAERLKGRTNYKNFVRAYVQQFLLGKINYTQLGRIFDKSELLPKVKAKILLKKEEVQEMIDKEIARVLSAKGITQETVIDMIMEAADLSRTKKQAANLLRAAEDLRDIFGMKAPVQKLTYEEEYTEIGAIEQNLGLEEPQSPEYLPKKAEIVEEKPSKMEEE